MIRLLKWFWMLSKRLYKKPSFLVLLAFIPISVLAFTFIAQQDSGFVHVLLAQENPEDTLSSQVIESLEEQKGLLRFTVTSPEEARKAVAEGNADEAWIFPENTKKEIEEYFRGEKKYVVSILTKEQNVALRLSREKLVGSLYESCARVYYTEYIRSNLPQLDSLSEEDLMIYFDRVAVDEDFFDVKNPASEANLESSSNYLTSPIRGLLGVLMVVCGMAAVMYHMQDEKSGTFAHVKDSLKGLVALGCVATAVINVAVVAAISLFFSSLAGPLWRELILLVLYTLCCASFCLFLRQIFSGLSLYSATIPLVAVGLIGICPVFFDFRHLWFLQILFPPTHYINSSYDNKSLLNMLLFTAAYLLLSLILKGLKVSLRRLLTR
jgi:ABC-2 type transport system permease protein